MKTAKIIEITKVNEWDWPHWKLYYINMALDNKEFISLGKKKPDAFKVGDTVNYEDYTDDKGKIKQREVKENTFKPKTYNSDNNTGAMIGMAMKLAFEHLYDKTNYNETYNLAVRIFEDSMALLENYWKNKSESKSEEDNEDSQLPF